LAQELKTHVAIFMIRTLENKTDKKDEQRSKEREGRDRVGVVGEFCQVLL